MSLSSETLKEHLWDTIQRVRSGDMSAIDARTVCSASREIMRVVRAEIDVSELVNGKPNAQTQRFLNTEKE